jgi:hypothetical protein
VERVVPLDVPEVLLLALRHHGRVAEDETPVGLADGEVSPLAVALGPRAHLRHVGQPPLDHPGGDLGIAGCPEVVGVGDEGVANPLLQQRLQDA